MMKILVLCTGNSARSILLEAIFRQRGVGRIAAFSAGSRPVGRVNPVALALLQQKGHPTNGFNSKSWTEFSGDHAERMDLIVTVCGNAEAEQCPSWPGLSARCHWGVADPAAVEGPPSAVAAAFAKAYDLLDDCAARFLAQNPWDLPIDRMESIARSIRPTSTDLGLTVSAP
jgi:arsenate reductase